MSDSVWVISIAVDDHGPVESTNVEAWLDEADARRRCKQLRKIAEQFPDMKTYWTRRNEKRAELSEDRESYLKWLKETDDPLHEQMVKAFADVGLTRLSNCYCVRPLFDVFDLPLMDVNSAALAEVAG